jgi:hypothetical protein
VPVELVENLMLLLNGLVVPLLFAMNLRLVAGVAFRVIALALEFEIVAGPALPVWQKVSFAKTTNNKNEKNF